MSSKYRTPVRSLTIFLVVMGVGWFGFNLSTIRWNSHPETVALAFAKSFNPDLTGDAEWVTECIRTGFPGVVLALSRETPQGTVRVELRSFLGLGWQEQSYELGRSSAAKTLASDE